MSSMPTALAERLRAASDASPGASFALSKRDQSATAAVTVSRVHSEEDFDMAEPKANRSDTSREGGQAVARREQDRGSLQRRQPFAGWPSNPFDAMERVTEEMERVFDRQFRDFGLPPRSRFG